MAQYKLKLNLSDGTNITTTNVIDVPEVFVPQWWYFSGTLSRSIGANNPYINGQSITLINNTGSAVYALQMTSSNVSKVNIRVGDIIFDSYGEIGCVTFVPPVGSANYYLKATTRWMSNMQWYCLEEGTRIKMFDGTEKPIEEVQKGDSILGWDFENEQPIEAVAVFSRFTHRDDKTNYVVFSNGEYLSATDDHYIYCVNKGRDAPITELQEGDVCLDSEGNEIEIYAIHRGIYGMGMKNYYHVVSSNNTYFANNVMNAAHPINKFNWMSYANGEQIPEEIMNILRQDAEEFNTFEFLVKNDDFRRQSVALTKEIKTRGNERDRLKQYLFDTDYVAIKYSEGKEIDENILIERQNARDRINQLTDEIDNIYLPAYNQLVIDYSPLGADTLLSNEERRAKYFKIANKRDNEALNIFKQYYQPQEEEEE